MWNLFRSWEGFCNIFTCAWLSWKYQKSRITCEINSFTASNQWISSLYVYRIFNVLWLDVIFIQRVVRFLTTSLTERIENTATLILEFISKHKPWELVFVEFKWCFNIVFFFILSYRQSKPNNLLKVFKKHTPLHVVCNLIEIKVIMAYFWTFFSNYMDYFETV